MRRVLRLGLIFALVAAMLLPAAVAAGTVSNIKLNQVQQRGAALTMYVSMSDSAGNPCTGSYTADQFSISVDGKALDVDTVQAFDPQTQGIHYVFSVDVSKSVSTVMMDNVRLELTEFINSMGPLDTASVITFGERVTQLLVGSSDRAQIIQAIDSIAANEGMTALYKGVIDGVEIAASTGGRSAVVVITDGKNDPTEDMKSFTKESIYESVKSAQVPLYCIGLNDKNGVDDASLVELALATGGDQFIINTPELSGSLDKVRAIMQSAVVLNATLINTDNKAGFDEISTFKVGFQPLDGPFVTSNELQQNINWKNVPVPVVTPSPTPVPQIALSLDESEMNYAPGSAMTITGAIELEQGSVAPEELSITVNGEQWQITSIMLNGTDYTFRAEGVIFESTDSLEVQAEIKAIGVASRVQHVNLVLPTAAPTATPAPILSVELDDSGRGIMYEAGKTVSLSGVVNVQGVIDSANLNLFVNDVSCDMTVMQINHSQYEFSADYVLGDEVVEELSVQVQLNGTEIYSRVQRLYLETPTPTPDPELTFSLSDAGIEHIPGEAVTIRGNIEVLSGDVASEDLALYVNNVRWEMQLEALSDGTYGFTASNTLVDDITQLNIKVRLDSNTKIVSNEEQLPVTTPEPTASPTPTPRPEVTPPPTAEPTQAPATPVAVETPVPQPTTLVDGAVEKVNNIIDNLKDRGLFIYVAIGAGVLLLLIIALIVLLVVRGAKKRRQTVQPIPSQSWVTGPRDNDAEVGATRREDDTSAPTVRRPGDGSDDSDFISDSASAKKNAGNGGAPMGGTIRITDETSAGTRRFDDFEEVGGTMRIDDDVPSLDVEVEENNAHGRRMRTIHIERDQELIFGRDGNADIIIDDGTVSSRHMKMTYDGDDIFISDLGSTNGTRVDNQKLMPGVVKQVKNGDTIVVGKTRLTFRF